MIKQWQSYRLNLIYARLCLCIRFKTKLGCYISNFSLENFHPPNFHLFFCYTTPFRHPYRLPLFTSPCDLHEIFTLVTTHSSERKKTHCLLRSFISGIISSMNLASFINAIHDFTLSEYSSKIINLQIFSKPD